MITNGIHVNKRVWLGLEPTPLDVGTVYYADAWLAIIKPEALRWYGSAFLNTAMVDQQPCVMVAKITVAGWKCYYGSTKDTITRILYFGAKVTNEDLARYYFPFIPKDRKFQQ